MPRNAGALH
jgi:hypothetical protein